VLIRSVKKEIQRREEVTQLAKSLEQANLRLKELDQQKTEFLSIASHQLRTPLSITKGFIELIQDGAYGKVGAKLNSVLQDMDTSNERLVKLIDEFLDVTRIEQGRTKFVFEKKDLKDVVESVVKELHPKAESKNMSIITQFKTRKTTLTFDEEKIRHVIFNFVDNAIKYSENGAVHVVVEEESGGLSVKVRDRGLGFDKVDGANFFQKFYRGDNVKGTNVNGTGLGIYVCRKFVENHGGKVWATSAGLGKGSEFGFWIPFAFSAKT
jgi:signal transduction histidine kinase